MRFVIAIPTYNEAENIGPLIKEIYKELPEAEVLVVDDGSPDGTSMIVKEFMRSFSTLLLLERKGERGFAGAYRAAFGKVLRESNADFIITMDADFSHHPRYLKKMLEKAPSCDVVIGSRYISGGTVKNWGLRRRFLSRAGNWYARNILGLPIRDVTSGFTCVRASFLEKIPWSYTAAEGYAWLIEMKTLFYRNGARILEIPIIFEERRRGASKISRNIIVEGLIYPFKLKFSRRSTN